MENFDPSAVRKCVYMLGMRHNIEYGFAGRSGCSAVVRRCCPDDTGARHLLDSHNDRMLPA
jgi:hypothetical protein